MKSNKLPSEMTDQELSKELEIIAPLLEKSIEKMKKDLENIHYNLTVLGGGYASDEMQNLITKTIIRLPEDLWEKVSKEVLFICGDGAYGQYEGYRPSIFNKEEIFHFVILSLAEIKDEEEQMFTIAHEIAHFVLGHYQGNMREDQDIEVEADDLCKKWGFIIPDRRKDL